MVNKKSSVAVEAPRFLRSAQCAEFLGVSRSHLERMRADGTGPRFTKISKKVILYALADVEAWVAKHSTTTEQKKSSSWLFG